MPAQWEAMARLLRRTGFGATGAHVDAAVRLGPQRYVAQLLAADPTKDPGAKATPAPSLPVIPRQRKKDSSTEQRKAYRKKLVEQQRTATAWWLRRMVAVQQPFGEKLTLIWHNHFATSAQKVKFAPLMLAQNDKLRRLGRGDFHTLAYAILTDPAMLLWLDGEKNTAKAPNENLAREFMELFTLGHNDGYTEEDVRQGARALTGWVVKPDGTAASVAQRHDNGSKTFLGVTGNLDAAGYCDAVLARPGSPRYLATRTWSQLASDTAPAKALVDRLAAAYGPKRDLSAMLAAMLSAPEFTAARGTTVIDPVEWLIGAVRALRVPIRTDTDAEHLARVLRSLGKLPFYPPSVGGWPSGQAWLSTAAADIRMQAATALAQGADLSALDGSAPSRVDAVAHLLGISAWSPRTLAVLRASAANPQRLVTVALNTPEYLTN